MGTSSARPSSGRIYYSDYATGLAGEPSAVTRVQHPPAIRGSPCRRDTHRRGAPRRKTRGVTTVTTQPATSRACCNEAPCTIAA